MTTYNRNEIDIVPVVRVSTGFQELDWLYDSTDKKTWGLPMRAISLWAGESGTGKTRTAVAVCNAMALKGMRILYFQAESDLGTFSQKIRHDSFRLSDSRHLADMKKDIYADRPHIVVVDSVNMIKEFKSGTAAIIESIIDEFRDVCRDIGSHVVLLGQLNQNGTIKGSTALPHLVDVALNIRKGNVGGGCFWIEIGIKNRFGRTGPIFKTVWQHTDSGVICISDARKVDKKWKKSHGIISDFGIRRKRTKFSSFVKK